MNDGMTSLRERLVRWLATEPLVHFLLLGALIFIAYDTWGLRNDAARLHITVGPADQQRLRAMARQQWGKEPDAAQMQVLIARHVREEVLYREALAAGLERDDVIVRRRLVQKMEFLAQEDARPADENALRAYFASNASQYSAPETRDLEVAYFSPAVRGASARPDAIKALKNALAGASPQGDNFLLGTILKEQTQAGLERDFGHPFGQAVWQIPVGTWAGPVESAHGWHLVRVLRQAAARPARYEEVRERIASDWAAAAIDPAQDAAYSRLRARYTVDVRGPTPP